MRLALILFGLMANSAAAHPGHIVDVAGHGHWVGAAAIGLAILVGLWGKHKEREAAQDDDADEAEEAAA